MICTSSALSSQYVIFQQENLKHLTFKDLDAKVIPVFPIKRSIKIKQYSVQRKQVPICSASSLTDYKVQGLTLTIAVLNLKYKKYCSTNVQTSIFERTVPSTKI